MGALVDVLAVVQSQSLERQGCGQDAACAGAADEVKQVPDGPPCALFYLPQHPQRGDALCRYRRSHACFLVYWAQEHCLLAATRAMRILIGYLMGPSIGLSMMIVAIPV